MDVWNGDREYLRGCLCKWKCVQDDERGVFVRGENGVRKKTEPDGSVSSWEAVREFI